MKYRESNKTPARSSFATGEIREPREPPAWKGRRVEGQWRAAAGSRSLGTRQRRTTARGGEGRERERERENSITRQVRFFFSDRQSARGKPSGSALSAEKGRKTGGRRQRGGQTSFRDGGVPSLVFLLSLRDFPRAAGGAGTLVLLAPAPSSSPGEKCNRARDSELLNFAETAREL
jgi:hypothetical protein